MKILRVAVLTVLAALVIATQAEGILIRHDREGDPRVTTRMVRLHATMAGSAAPAKVNVPAAAQAPAAPSIPDTPAGKRMAAWLPVIQAGQAVEIREFVETNSAKSALAQMSVEERTRALTDFFGETGGVRLQGIEQSSDVEIIIRAQAVKTGDAWRIGLRVESEQPHGILGFLFIGAPPPAEPRLASSKLSEAELPRAIDDYLEKLAADDRFSGSVLVAKNGQPLFEKAYGLASKRYNAPNRVDTKYNLGSMNKMFTAVAIAQLVEQGKLSLEDKVGKILPDYPNAAVREKVKVHHLLTHTSGLGSYWNEKYHATWRSIRTVQDFLKLFWEESPSFEPGARFEYSNAGFIVLGAIIEKVSGQSYYDTVREHVFKPAGMNDTDSFEMDQEIPNLATGYTNVGANDRPQPGPRRNNLFLHVVKGGPAGGGYSTVPDLLKFDIALRTNKLLSAKMRDTVLSGKVAMGPDMKYAYGFGEQTVGGKRIVGHNGGAPGISAVLDVYWDDGYTVAVLSNYDRAAVQVSNTIRGMLTGSAR